MVVKERTFSRDLLCKNYPALSLDRGFFEEHLLIKKIIISTTKEVVKDLVSVYLNNFIRIEVF